ncbi:hypothetical protein [Turneriella parva]|nr:hypothetical protein [Turneriella parva]
MKRTAIAFLLCQAIIMPTFINADDAGNTEATGEPAERSASEYKGGTSALSKPELPLFALHFVLMTDHPKAVAGATPERLQQIENLLNEKFASTGGENLARFKIRSFADLEVIKNSTCPEIYESIVNRTNTRYGDYWKCKDLRVRAPQGITIFIKHHDKDKLSYGGRVNGMPFAQINWERFLKDQRVFLHELGHAFGLGHSCPPTKAKPGRPNVMNFSKGCKPLPEGEAGWLYTPSQAATVKKRRDAYAKKFRKTKDPIWDKVVTDNQLTR